MQIHLFRQQFDANKTYFDSATMGLAPVNAVQEMGVELDKMVKGESNAVGFDDYIERSRIAYAKLCDVPLDWISIIPAASIATGVMAACLNADQTVLVAEEDFTSVLFPILQLEQKGVNVRVVKLDKLLETIDDSIDWVAVSAVQSKDGRVLDLDKLEQLCTKHNVKSFVDVTQAAGWMAIKAQRFDITAAGAYKWLLCPRGSGFLTINPELMDDIPPIAPGWYSGEAPWESIYSPPLRLANNARRYDISPAWICWVGAAYALELLADTQVTNIQSHNLQLANQFRAGMGIAASNSAICSLLLNQTQVTTAKQAGFVFSERAGSSRFSFHAYNTAEQVDGLLQVLSNLN